MSNERIRIRKLIYFCAFVVIAWQIEGIYIEDPRIELWPVYRDQGAVLNVYNVADVNETAINCTVWPHYPTSLKRKHKHAGSRDWNNRDYLNQTTYDIEFENEGNMTCILQGSMNLVSNTLTARFQNADTFVAALDGAKKKDIAKVIKRYNKKKGRRKIRHYFRKNGGHLIVHIALLGNGSLNSNQTEFINSMLYYLKEHLIYWRNTRYCVAEFVEELYWPNTPVGRSTAPDNPCIDENGVPGPIRQCLGDVVTGAYWDAEPEIEDCQKSNEMIENLQRIENQTETLETLLNSVKDNPRLSVYEIMKASNKLRKLGLKFEDHSFNSNKTQPNVTAAVGIVDALMESGEKVFEKVEQRSSSCNNILEAVNDILVASATSTPTATYGSYFSTFTVEAKAGVRGIMSVREDVSSSAEIIHHISWKENVTSANLSNSAWGVLLMDYDELGMAASVYRSASIFDDGDRSKKVASPVIGLELFDENKTSVDEGASALFIFPIGNLDTKDKPLCSSWNTYGGIGRWSQEGCALTSNALVPGNMYGCLCNRFSNIALLIASGDSSDGPTLQMITMVGISSSFICIAISFLYTAFNPKRFRSVYGKIELNLFLSIFLLDATQLVVMFFKFSAGGATCIAIGVTLHYSVLATFTWMMVVGVMHMLRLSPKTLLIARNKTGNHLLLKSSIFGWGVAAVPVIATLCSGPHHYVSNPPTFFCYPKGVALYSAVIFPVGLASVINTLIFGWILAMLFCVKGIRFQKTNWTQQKMRRIFFMLFLFCLLGLYWILGLLIEAVKSHKPTQLILKYVFCVTAPLHGLFLFVFLVLCERGFRYKFQTSVNRLSKIFSIRSTLKDRPSLKKTKKYVEKRNSGQSISIVKLPLSESVTDCHSR